MFKYFYDGFIVKYICIFQIFLLRQSKYFYVTVGPAAHEPAADEQQHRRGDGSQGLLHLDRVGRDGGAGAEEREVLPLLRGGPSIT